MAGLDRPTVEALTAYGHAFGMVFQIVDDLLDLTATEEAARQAGPATTSSRACTRCPSSAPSPPAVPPPTSCTTCFGAPLSVAECDKALAIVRSGTGVRETIELGAAYVAKAADSVEELKPGPVTDALHAPRRPHCWPASPCPEPRRRATPLGATVVLLPPDEGCGRSSRARADLVSCRGGEWPGSPNTVRAGSTVRTRGALPAFERFSPLADAATSRPKPLGGGRADARSDPRGRPMLVPRS